MKNEITFDWYDYLFKGVQNEFAGKPVKFFVMGTNQWRDEDDWPLDARASHKIFPAFIRQSKLTAGRMARFPRRVTHTEKPDQFTL